MKKLIIVVLIMIPILIQAQTHLFKGIKSGMSESQYVNYLNTQEDFTYYKKTFYEVEISSKKYLTGASFNSKDQLWGLALFSYNNYEWFDYDVNIKPMLLDIYTLLQAKYGNPDKDTYYGWTEIPDEGFKTICEWNIETIRLTLNVQESNNNYSIFISFVDDKFYEPEINDTGGF